MDMVAEEEGRVAAKSDGSDESIPGWVEEELDEGDNLEDYGEDESRPCCNLREDRERGIANETSSDARNGILVNW